MEDVVFLDADALRVDADDICCACHALSLEDTANRLDEDALFLADTANCLDEDALFIDDDARVGLDAEPFVSDVARRSLAVARRLVAVDGQDVQVRSC